MKINMRNLVPAAVATIVFLGVIVSVLPYPMAAKRLPLLVSVIAIILLGIVIARELMPQKEDPSIAQEAESADAKNKKTDIPAKVLLKSAGWILGIVVLIGLFGFIIGSALYVFLYCRFHDGSWMASILLALGVSAFIYFVFVVGLHFLLPKGLLIELLLV
jgi:hypothetical protein